MPDVRSSSAINAASIAASAIDPARQPYWAPAPATLWCCQDDVTFLLSLETGRYHTLDDVAGAAWRGMCEGEALDAIAQRIAAGYGDSVDARDVLADLCELLPDLSRRGLIVPLASPPAPPPGSPPASAAQVTGSGREHHRHPGALSPTSSSIDSAPPALPSVSACLMRLAIVHVLMKCFGLRKLLRHVARKTSGPLRAPTPSFVAALAQRVGTAKVWYPFGSACLEHSVCLLWMMRRAGCEVDLRIGVQPFPFSAHAWVECGGEPINESPERVALFKPFPAITLDLL
jgi:hypothetical protein